MRIQLSIAILILCNVLLAATPVAAEERKQVVAVIPVGAGPGVSEALPLALTDLLSSEVFKTGRFVMANRAEIEKALGEQKLQMSDICDSTKCIAEVGGAIGAEKLVVAAVKRVQRTYLLTLKLLDVAKIREDFADTITCVCEEQELLARVRDLVQRMVTGKVEAAPPVEPDPDEPAPRTSRLRQFAWELSAFIPYAEYGTGGPSPEIPGWTLQEERTLESLPGFGLRAGFNATRRSEVFVLYAKVYTRFVDYLARGFDLEVIQTTYGAAYQYHWHLTDGVAPYAVAEVGRGKFEFDDFEIPDPNSTSTVLVRDLRSERFTYYRVGGGFRFFMGESFTAFLQAALERQATVTDSPLNVVLTTGFGLFMGGRR